MSTGPDEDALSWDGDDDPTLTGASSRPAPSSLPRGFTPVGRGAERVTRDERRAAAAAAPAGEATPLGNAALVGIGMIAAAFILFSVGWLIVSVRLQSVPGLPVPGPTLLATTLAAAAAPLVWFGAVYALTRRSRAWVRFVWLGAGLVLLVPWPFLLTGAFA